MSSRDSSAGKPRVVVRSVLLILLLAALAYVALTPQTQAESGLAQADPGPYQAGWTIVSVPRPDAQAGTFQALLVYPATEPGENQPFDGSGGPYPALSFGHSFLSVPERNLQTLKHLATHGYVVIGAKTNTGWDTNHISFAADLSDSLTYLEQQNQDSRSPYYQKIDVDSFGIFGYSMGGGASILAAANDPRVKAVVNLAAAQTRPPAPLASEAAARLSVPMRMLAGSDDGIATLAGHQQVIYDSARPPKQLAVFRGGYHCGFSEHRLCIVDRGTMDRDTQLTLTRYGLTTWFDYYLKDDTSLEEVVWGSELESDPRVRVQFERGDPSLPPAESP